MSSSDDSSYDSSTDDSAVPPPPVAKKAGRRKAAASTTPPRAASTTPPPQETPSLHTKGKLIDEIEARFGGIEGLKKEKKGLKQICNSNPEEFGHSGTPERRAIQKRVDLWKRYAGSYLDDKLEHREQQAAKKKTPDLDMSRQIQAFGKATAAKKPTFSDSTSDEESVGPSTSKCKRCNCRTSLE
jgi:hypothetical protein